MQITMTFRHMEASDATKDFVKEKLEKLEKYFNGVIRAKVVLSVERYLNLCDITITSKGNVFKGHEETDDMYTSIDKVIDKLERQIEKNKGKYKSNRTSSA